MTLDRRHIDLRRNPAVTQETIEHNFKVLFDAFNELMQQKLNDVRLNKIQADAIYSGSSDIADLFIPASDKFNVVRIVPGSNIITGGTDDRPIVNVSNEPSFQRIFSGKTDLSDLFLTRREARISISPKFGPNMLVLDKKNSRTIDIKPDPTFSSVDAKTISASTSWFDEIYYKGKELSELFPPTEARATSIQYVRLRSIDWSNAKSDIEANFNTLVNMLNSLLASKLDGLEIGNKTEIITNTIITPLPNDVSFSSITLNDMHVADGNASFGLKPEVKISSFQRTKFRVAAAERSPNYNAFVVQNIAQENRHVLNDESVDFVVRGDGKVGIGAFNGLNSLLTIRSDNGYDQLRLTTPYTPNGKKDENGDHGNIAWDEDFLYVKTKAGWKKIKLSDA